MYGGASNSQPICVYHSPFVESYGSDSVSVKLREGDQRAISEEKVSNRRARRAMIKPKHQLCLLLSQLTDDVIYVSTPTILLILETNIIQ